ncbi:MAG: hypothetical protein ACREJ5_16605 [Geminicoccaceae bacterium]
MFGSILQIVGLVLEITGIFLMANMYVRRLPKRALLLVILSALGRGETARDAVTIAEIWPENKLISLQGLALVGGGFVIQMIGLVVATIASYEPLAD